MKDENQDDVICFQIIKFVIQNVSNAVFSYSVIL